MELIRLTAVDESGQILVDELCYPSYMVIDLNSRYSGIKTLAEVRNDLKGVRDMLFKYVDKDTILLGHGLENDLQALRVSCHSSLCICKQDIYMWYGLIADSRQDH